VAGVDVASDDFARQLEDAREQQRAITKVLRAVATSEGLQPVLDEVVRAATLLCGGDYGGLYMAEGGGFRAFSIFTAPSAEGPVEEHAAADRKRLFTADRTTLVGRVALTRDVVDVPDLREDPEYSFPLLLGHRGGLGVPVVVDDELIAAIVVTRPGSFEDAQIRLVKTFADQAAIAIANARLLETVERQLEQQRAIGDVLAAVARAEGLDSVLHALVEAAARLCEADFGEVHLVDGDLLKLAVGHGGPPELYEHAQQHPVPVAGDRSSVNGRVALSRDVVHIPDILEDPDYSWNASEPAGIRALLGAPLLVEDELVGVFNIVRTEPVAFTGEQIELLRTFADQGAIAVSNARLLEAVERQKSELSRFVSPQVAELLSSEDGERLLLGHRGYVTILFCDLRGFTAFTETAEPEELFEVLRDYHAAIGELIPQYEGTLEHFQGDGLMVFFNDPVPVEDHELKAISLALAAQERVGELTAKWRKRGIDLDLGIGIAAGYATLGRVGFEGRYDYGALGTATNLAARLTAHAGPGQTLISQRVHAIVEERVHAEHVGDLDLKGFGRPVPAYDVRGLR
jgi:class 3 adenylate cyclase